MNVLMQLNKYSRGSEGQK